jgi:hypothetical protein
LRGARKHSSDDGGGGGGCGVSSQSVTIYLLLAEADGKHEREEDKKQRCAREGKNHRVKKRGDGVIRDPNHPH